MDARLTDLRQTVEARRAAGIAQAFWERVAVDMQISVPFRSLLVRTGDGHAMPVPMAARMHEGVVWSNRDR